MQQAVRQSLVSAIHQQGRPLVVSVTGGGARAVSDLLSVPGASATVLEARVPYAAPALAEWLGGEPPQYCSDRTARAMAVAGWMRARELAPEADPSQILGVAATAALATTRPKRGDHRVHVAVHTLPQTASLSLTLDKGARTRDQEENLAAGLLLTAITEAVGLDPAQARASLAGSLRPGELVESDAHRPPAEWIEVVLGQRGYVLAGPANAQPPETQPPRLVVPGSFNPPHAGHLKIAAVAEQISGQPTAWELAVTNVDKPPLDYIEIRNRVAALQEASPGRAAALTASPTFRGKAQLFPGAVFCVGVDTILRVADLRYYGNSQEAFSGAIEEFAATGCRFLVFGRLVEGRFVTLDSASLPASLRVLCDGVPAAEFREDVSSTALRNADSGSD
ncbi:MAG: hypothetical protein AAGA92_00720 [Planctomycetota bacterium]